MMASDIVRDLPLIVSVFGNTTISGVFRAKGVESGEALRPPGAALLTLDLQRRELGLCRH